MVFDRELLVASIMASRHGFGGLKIFYFFDLGTPKCHFALPAEILKNAITTISGYNAFLGR
ncbi:hypothetical protein LRA02_11550 [Lentilactobacillus rapi]|uniref:Uncharacterized protein n=1 Tax=Lentilactobacillus rapi TaxID=481723 RepID=A0A512PM65_9LACO|nr:hypothetical protein LRA02_11550 [Lentilactobacillus rapi]